MDLGEPSEPEQEVYSQEKAREVLYELLVDMKLRSKLTAKDSCILAYWAVLSGAEGDSLKRLAKAPGDSATGHYSAKFDSCTGLNIQDPDFAFVNVPVYNHGEATRTVRPIAAYPPQLTIEKEIASIAGFQKELESYVQDLPPVYFTHSVTRAAMPSVAVPLAFYMDGVQYAGRGNVVGVWLVNLVTGKRHLILNLRKGLLCRCGCNGWCSYWAIFNFVNWCFEALAVGKHKQYRSDGLEFTAGETNLSAQAGQPCPRGAVLFLKADLAEFGGAFGFWGHASLRFPCLFCEATRSDMLSLSTWDAVTHPFRTRTFEDYTEACARCEFYVTITSKAQPVFKVRDEV